MSMMGEGNKSRQRKSLGLVHSTRLIVEAVHTALSSGCPEIDLFHVVDEGILRTLGKKGALDQQIISWLGRLVRSVEEAGAAAAVVTCSSLSPAVSLLREEVGIPLLKIDEPMMEWAVDQAERVGMVMTNPTTERPSRLLFADVARRRGRAVHLEPRLLEEAFHRLSHGDVREHDRSVLSAVRALLQETDIVLLAQISMARIKDQLDPKLALRVYSSLDFIAQGIKALLAEC